MASSCSSRDGTWPGRALQSGCIVPSPQVIVYNFLEGRRGHHFRPVLVAGQLNDFEYVQIAYPESKAEPEREVMIMRGKD